MNNNGNSNVSSKISVCIAAHKAYGALQGGTSGHIGGVEWQTSLMAKWLSNQGHSVSMLTWDEGGPPVEVIDGVRIIKICRQDSGLPALRFFHPKWSGLTRAMRQADADVYYQNGSECVTGQVAMWCRNNRRKFVFSSASDGDCEAHLPGLVSFWERKLYCYGLRHTAATIVQTEKQRALLKSNFQLESQMIPMPCAHAISRETPADIDKRPKRVLWIGRIYQVKRPDRLVELAENCPEITFDLVGPAYSDAYTQQVVEKAKQTKNIVVHGAVRPSAIHKFYQNAAALCCTSEFEGFPNTFLEAWSHGLPVISTVDPDSILQKRNLGMFAKDVPEMTVALRALFDSPARYQEMSRNARQYVYDNHRIDAVLPKFEEIFRHVSQ
jgi:glycosyltransferase involved in cell wall biosynthesis